MRGRRFWRESAVALSVVLLAPLLGITPARAAEVVLEFLAAEARLEGRDVFAVFGDRQDFFPVTSVAGVAGPVDDVRSNRDFATWSDYTVIATVDPALRFYTVNVALEEAEDSGSEVFDIHPATGQTGYSFTFDACTLRYTDAALTPLISYQPLGQQWLPFGNGEVSGGGGPDPEKDARVEISISTGDGRPFTTDDLALKEAGPFQAAYDPAEIIEDKPTAFKVRIESTFTTSVSADITVNLNDGVAPRIDSASVVVPPGGLTAFLFEDDPFLPKKDLVNNVLSYSVTLTVSAETHDPDDCESQNNELVGDAVPIVKTQDKITVYRPFDAVLPGGAADIISAAELTAMFNTSESYRKAIFPLASLDGSMDATPIVSGAGIPFNTVGGQLLRMSMAASSAGIERMILVSRSGSLDDIGAAGAAGMSLGGAAPHAVFADHDTTMTASHELAHTFNLSRRNCTNGGLEEFFFNIGCMDEYEHTSPPRPYVAEGYDVEGAIFPAGFNGIAGTRDVKANNLMDLSADVTSFDRWIDSFTFAGLTDAYRVQGDPELVGLWGWVEMPGGLQDPSISFNGALLPAYRYDGFPDLPEPVPNGPASGFGRFELRILTQGGTYLYRFNPGYATDGSSGTNERGFFGLALTWPQNVVVTAVELWGPSDVDDPGVPADTFLASMTRTAIDPVVSGLRAGRDVTPTFAGPQPEPPTIGPLTSAVVAWQASDADSPALRTALHVKPPFNAGEYSDWLPMMIDESSGQFTIPHAWMQERPGTYAGRVLVTDGLNSKTFEQADLFTICNFTNSGVEICDGVDDDCDGTVDNASPPGPGIGLKVAALELSWDAFSAAETYDVVRGTVSVLRQTNGDFKAATDGCIADDTTNTSVFFPDLPSPGDAIWVLVRGSNCVGDGTYDSGGSGQSGGRDTGIDKSLVSCS